MTFSTIRGITTRIIRTEISHTIITEVITIETMTTERLITEIEMMKAMGEHLFEEEEKPSNEEPDWPHQLKV